MLTKTIAAGLVALTTLSAVPASAGSFSFQYGGGNYNNSQNWGNHGGQNWDNRGDHHRHRQNNRISTDQVRYMLRDAGYYRIRFVDDRGAVYQLRASRHGRDFYLVVNARTGEILSRQRI
jgi:hypothetical protein